MFANDNFFFHEKLVRDERFELPLSDSESVILAIGRIPNKIGTTEGN